MEPNSDKTMYEIIECLQQIRDSTAEIKKNLSQMISQIHAQNETIADMAEQVKIINTKVKEHDETLDRLNKKHTEINNSLDIYDIIDT